MFVEHRVSCVFLYTAGLASATLGELQPSLMDKAAMIRHLSVQERMYTDCLEDIHQNNNYVDLQFSNQPTIHVAYKLYFFGFTATIC